MIFDELRRVALAGTQFREILDPLEEHKFARWGNRNGIASAVPAVVNSFGGLVRLTEITLKESSAAHQQFAVRRDLPFQRRRLGVGFQPMADGFEIIALALVDRHDTDLGRAIQIA